MGRSNAGAAAGTSGAGAGSTSLATIGATGSGFGTSALASSRIGRGGAGGAGRRGATTGADGNFTSSVAGKMNTPIDRMRGVDGFSDARIGTTIRTTATMACNTTLSHRPVVERPCGRVLNRASSNRIDMCRTELKCRSVLLQRRCCLGSSYSKRSAAAMTGTCAIRWSPGRRAARRILESTCLRAARSACSHRAVPRGTHTRGSVLRDRREDHRERPRRGPCARIVDATLHSSLPSGFGVNRSTKRSRSGSASR